MIPEAIAAIERLRAQVPPLSGADADLAIIANALAEEQRVSSFYVAQLREIRADIGLRESIPSGATDGGSFWSYDGADLEFHDSQTEAQETAVRALAFEADQAGSDGWDDNVTNIAWGFCVVAESVRETARQDGHLPTCGEDCDEACKLTSGFDSWADYGLVAVLA